jgi:hypothetical protein
MAASNQGPFRDQDAITATALGFAGMTMLQSKLFPAVSRINLPWMHKLLELPLLHWWPLLLIASGIAFWLAQAVGRKARKDSSWEAGLGGAHGSRNQS